MKVLLVGAGGYFGRLIAAEIADAGMTLATPSRAELDLREPAALGRRLDAADACVCAAGPFQSLPTSLAAACIERGLPYLDIADDAVFVERVRGLAAAARAPVCSAWSTVSALTGLLARLAAGDQKPDSVRCFLAPGNRGGRNAATIASLLSSLGCAISVPAPGGARRALGWSEPVSFPFPPPVGERTCRLADSADHALLPALLGAPAVEFRVGAELVVVNWACLALALLAEPLSLPLRPYAGVLAAALRPLGRFGTEAGGVGVEALAGGRRARASLVAERGAPRLAALPIRMTLERIAAGWRRPGFAAHDRWASRAELERHAARLGARLVVEHD